VKFLCDRCKTRYSIGDDRVRGKILKIRCKNCANVITVREGMTDEGGADEGARRGRPTTGAPNPSHTAPVDSGRSGALSLAFANQMTKPPAALEEEWYVSIDGDQSGPFSLADAQKWVGGKAWDADLHCWSEGFDDWLPVDKVSHFRNLRRKPLAPQAPPPLPRVGGGALRTQAAPQEDEPKPLFAATMASLEKGASDPKVALPPIGSTSTAKGAGVAMPNVIRTNGSPVTAPAVPAKPQLNAKGTAASKAVPAGAKVPRAGTTPGVGTAMTAGAAALAAAFDVEDSGDSLTAVEAPSFDDEVATTAEPVAAKRAVDRVDSLNDRGHMFPKGPGGAQPNAPSARAAAVAPARMPIAAPPAQPSAPSLADQLADDENLEIGEVSRVVKLADLAKMGSPRKQSRAPLRPSGSLPRIGVDNVGMQPGLTPDAGGAPLLDPSMAEGVVSAPVVAQAHRRGMIMLLAFAAVLLLGVAGAVVLLVTSNGDDDLPLGLGRSSQIDTSRPEETPGHHGGPDTGTGTQTVIKQPFVRRCPPYCGNTVIQPHVDETPVDPTQKRLEASEIEDMAGKQGEGTRRCYMRAQKGALGIEIQDLKKIAVTLSVDKDGLVTDVQLSDHAADALGKCLIARIKSWKFRTSPGGTYRFSLAFSNL
jgi:predicted Zn finger-like uncharacterized protein